MRGGFPPGGGDSTGCARRPRWAEGAGRGACWCGSSRHITPIGWTRRGCAPATACWMSAAAQATCSASCNARGWPARASIRFCPLIRARPKASNCARPICWRRNGTYHALLFNHAFEHVPNPRELLQKAAAMLEPGGCVVVRIPLADSFAFFHYGADWFQWDAPRHQNLFTRDSFRRLAELRAGAWKGRSTTPAASSSGPARNTAGTFSTTPRNPTRTIPGKRSVSKRQIREYGRWAKWLNQLGAGDQATFICRKAAKA
jgi:hypothetical protein